MRKFLLVLMFVLSCSTMLFSAGKSEAGNGGMTEKLEFYNDKMGIVDYSVREAFAKKASELTGFDVSVIAAPEVASYQTSIQQSIRSSSAPGLFTWWGGAQLETLVSNGLLVDLTDVWQNDLIPQGVSSDVSGALTVDGRQYAVPYSVLYEIVIYNKDVFEKAGIDKEPETFDEFLDVCEKLKAVGVTPIVLKNDSWRGFMWFQEILGAMDSELYKGVCSGEIDYTDPRVKEAMEVWGMMLEKGYFSKIMSISDAKKMLALGEVGMILDTTTEIKRLADDYGMVAGEDLDVFAVPSMSDNRKVVYYEITPLCIPAASSQAETAEDAMHAWFSPEFQKYLFDNFGVIANGSVALDNVSFNEVLGYTTQPDEYELVLRYYENTPESVRNTCLDAFMKFQMQDSTVDEMLATCQSAADSYWK